MAYEGSLLRRVREVSETGAEWVEKKMFGGVAIMPNGNMASGIVENELMVRVGHDPYEDALDQPHSRESEFTGRPMLGLAMVSAEGTDADEELAVWTDRGIAFASILPAK